MIIKTDTDTIDLQTGGFAFCETSKGKEGTIKDWPELSPVAQGRLEQIQAEAEALVNEGKRLIAS